LQEFNLKNHKKENIMAVTEVTDATFEDIVLKSEIPVNG